MFTATCDGGLAWLVVVAALNTVASLYYYLRWLAPAFARDTAVLTAVDTRWATATALVAGVLALALGITAGHILALTHP